jgi:PIN domain nuclease of toxin-antitoxin system
MRLLLDTVTFIWAVSSPERLSRAAVSILQTEAAIGEISAVSLTEIAIKHLNGKLKFKKEDVIVGVQDLQLRILPYTAEHAFLLFDLPPRHADPFDRQIIAQALYEKIPVVTCDEKFALYKGLNIVW